MPLPPADDRNRSPNSFHLRQLGAMPVSSDDDAAAGIGIAFSWDGIELRPSHTHGTERRRAADPSTHLTIDEDLTMRALRALFPSRRRWWQDASSVRRALRIWVAT